MHISGVLIHVKPEQQKSIEQQILNFSGTEIHASTEKGKIIITIDVENDHQITDTIMDVNNLKGVLSAVMVYHYSDSELSQEEVA